MSYLSLLKLQSLISSGKCGQSIKIMACLQFVFGTVLPQSTNGCCSHCCLTEMITGDFMLSAEQLEAQAAQRRENKPTTDKSSERKIRGCKTYYCALCKVFKVSQYRLEEHNKTPSHLRKAADLADPKKAFKCTLCSEAFKIMGHLNRHNRSARHLAVLSSSQLD